MSKKKKGFAVMDKDLVKKISSMGGKASNKKGVAHKFTKEEALIAGSKGGKKTSENKEFMKEIGTKGGLATQKKKRENNGTS